MTEIQCFAHRLIYWPGAGWTNLALLAPLEFCASPGTWAGRRETSMVLRLTTGPLSFILRTTARPFSRFVTGTLVPKGSVGCAAVAEFMSKISPLAVRRPW